MKNESITFKLTKSEKDKLIEESAKRDISVSQLIREVVREYIFDKQKEN